MRSVLALAAVLATGIANASDVTQPPEDLAALWKIVQAQQTEIAALRSQLDETRQQVTATHDKVEIAEEQLGVTADYLDQVRTSTAATNDSTQLGGYGELHYNNLDIEDDGRDRSVDFHRFVLMFNHSFSDRLRFFSELEVEHSVSASDAPGEVALEQAFLEFDLNDEHFARAGVFLVPVGITNETHEPPTFYGVERNDVENIILPTTWSEAGAGVGGRYASGLSWDLAVHSGMKTPTSGGSAFRVRSGRQEVAEATANDLAYTARLKYTGIPGLELSGSYHYQTDASQFEGDGLGAAHLLSAHGIWTQGPFTLRALWAEWNLEGSGVELAGVDQQTGWYVEPSYRIGLGENNLGLYGRWEDVKGARTFDRFDQWEVGFNFWPHPDVVLKADWRVRDHDLDTEGGRDFEGFDLGVGYQF